MRLSATFQMDFSSPLLRALNEGLIGRRSVFRSPVFSSFMNRSRPHPFHYSSKYTKGNESEEERRKALMARGLPKRRGLEGVANVILVASGKGGVGKSTTAVNLALAMANVCSETQKQTVGLLDADIYGPSIPIMMNLSGQPFLDDDGKKMLPLTNYGLKCMSMGFLIRKSEDALVWRGPMVMGALEKLAHGTNWTGTDLVVVDMPPGTGDIHLSVAQTLDVQGAIVVSTPQKVALADARKAVSMFNAVNIPIIGCVENMSAFACPKCNQETRVFGDETTVENTAAELKVPFLGSVPLEPEIMRCSDDGTPIVLSNPQSLSAKIYVEMGKKVLEYLRLRPP